VRWTRLRRGDYSLLWDDHKSRPPERFVEATLDLSAGTTGQGHVIYTRGEHTVYTAPQWHGGLALVERPPDVLRYERYLAHQVGDAEVWRLRIVLLPATGR
jgi:hypothetical protein